MANWICTHRSFWGREKVSTHHRMQTRLESKFSTLYINIHSGLAPSFCASSSRKCQISIFQGIAFSLEITSKGSKNFLCWLGQTENLRNAVRGEEESLRRHSANLDGKLFQVSSTESFMTSLATQTVSYVTSRLGFMRQLRRVAGECARN